MTIGKRFSATIAAATMVLCLPLSVFAANVSAFTIDGVHLGMTSDQVMQVLAPRSHDFAGHPVKPTFQRMKCLDEMSNSTINEGTCIDSITTYVGGGNGQQPGNIFVRFTEDYPAHPHRVRATSISFMQQLPSASAESQHMYTKTVYARFGLPTYTADGGYFWCSAVPASRCTNDTINAAGVEKAQTQGLPNQSATYGLVGTPGVSLSASINLFDEAYRNARLRAMDQAQSRQTQPSM
jgi:hypothetical protein